MLIHCTECGIEKEILDKEFRRQVRKGRKYFFCSRSCCARHGNLQRPVAMVLDKICPVCGNMFQTKQTAHEATFCSRSCASKGSVTEYRRMKAVAIGKSGVLPHTLEQTAMGLRTREAWKYTELDNYLAEKCIPHLFEHILSGLPYIYDLALPGMKTIVEFDGPEHRTYRQQVESDSERDSAASKLGWTVIRIPVLPSKVIPSDVLFSYVS